MADFKKVIPRQIIAKKISGNIPVVSTVKCVQLVHKPRYGFGLTLKYCFSYDMKIDMDEEERSGASGSDADVSSECSDTPCSQPPSYPPETIDKVFVQWVMPNSSADQVGLMQGDEIININNSSVYGKKESEIQNLLQNSGSLDVDFVEGAMKKARQGYERGKGRNFRGTRWNPYDGYSSNHEEVSDNGSSLSLTSCSSENGTSPSSLSPPALSGDRCFVVTYGQPGEQETEEKKLGQMRFQLPLSYSDEEPQMENKSVSVPTSEIEASFVHVEKTDKPQKMAQVVGNPSVVHKGSSDDDIPVFEDDESSNNVGLTNSTTSSVLVDSLDTTATCVTVTTATYTTLATPQLTHGETGLDDGKEEQCSTSEQKLTLSQNGNEVWELRPSPRSPSPAQRRVSYLMATEGSSSLAAGNWVVKSVTSVMNGEVSSNLIPLKEEPSESVAPATCPCQGESDGDDDSQFQEQGEEYASDKLTVSEPVSLNYYVKTMENDTNETDQLLKSESRRHSLKRKCSAENVVEVEKEGYLSRKFGVSHGRRTWKQVYAILRAHVLYIYKDKPGQLVNVGQEEKPISIKSCIVDIAYDYRKRENVFRLTTYNGSQYLFQAKDKDSMMSWIAAIQKNNNPDEDKTGVTSENLIVRRKKDMDNEISSFGSGQQASKQIPPSSLKISGLKKSLSFKSNSGSQSSIKNQKKAIDGEPGKATWHNKVVNKMKKIGSTSNAMPAYQIPGYSVGLPLDRCPMSKNNPSLPLLVEHCCQVVENKGLESVGIYRVPGNSANVAALEEELNAKSPDSVDFEEQKWNDPNNMGSLLKKFLRKLPEGLVTSELYGGFIEANRKEGDDRMFSLKYLIQQLPCVYAETLGFLIRHLKRVSEHSDTNKMEIRNLAIVFGPTIVRTGEDNMMTMVNDMSDRFRIVESFITNFDWFFDNEPLANGSISPSSPPVEEFSRHIVSTNMLNSIEQAAVSFDTNESNWKFKSPSIKLPNFKNFMKHGSDSSKKSEHGGNLDPLDNGKISPVSLSPYPTRTVGGSQPNSPTTGRRKFIKRHHSTSNISSPSPVHDDFDRSKSEGEDDEITSPRASHATKAYSYARPPPPSYRELRDKGSFRGLPPHPGNSPQPVPKEQPVFSESGDTRDFNSLSEETKRRLLRVTLQKKVNEKKKQQSAENSSVESLPNLHNVISADFNKGLVNMSFVHGDVPDNKNLSTSPTGENNTDEQSVVFEPQLKASEIKKKFEHISDEIPIVPVEDKQPITCEPVPQLRRREGLAPSSSSRNFKIYSNAEVNFSQYRPNQINEWVQDIGQDRSSTEQKEPGRGRRIERAAEPWKGQRSASVSRTSFVDDETDVYLKRRSTSLQDLNVEDNISCERTRNASRSSESSDSSDDEGVHDQTISMSFDEKLRGLMQKSKLENKGKVEPQPVRKPSQLNRPPSYPRTKSSVEKMRAMDPGSKIQTGAVSSMKSLFESGAAHHHYPSKSRSSSISSTSSGSVLSSDTQRKKSSASTTICEAAELKQRVWETESPGDTRKKWKEPVWLARERQIKTQNSDSESSIPGTPDDNNNNVRKTDEKGDYVSKQYSRSASLPLKQQSQPVKHIVAEETVPAVQTEVAVSKLNGNAATSDDKTFGYGTHGSAPVKTITTAKNITSPKATVHRRIPSVSNSPEVKKDTTRKPVQYSKSLPAKNKMNSTKAKTSKSVPMETPPTAPKPKDTKNVPRENETSVSNANDTKCLPTETTIVASRSKDNKNVPAETPSRASKLKVTKSLPVESPSTLPKPKHTKGVSTEAGNTVPKQKGVARTRRRIVSDTHHRGYPDSRNPGGRTFTAPILGSVVTTTAFELEGFAIKPQNLNRCSKSQRSLRKSDKVDGGQSRHAHHTKQTLSPPKNSLNSENSIAQGRRKEVLGLPGLDDEKRLSTDRSILEQNALHIKELLDEMNTEHSLKMERQKSDTISMNAQKAARKKALMRRHSLGQEKENGIVVTTCGAPSNGINEHNRKDMAARTPTNNDIQRNISTVKWVGVSS